MAEPDTSRVVDIMMGQHRSAVSQSIQDLDEDPDKAARAIQLGKATGVPPVVINQDQDNFEREHKASILKDILDNNPELREWTIRNPMASKVASDDWGQLDKLTQRIKNFGYDITPPVTREAARGFAVGTSQALGAAGESLAKEYEEAPPYIRNFILPYKAKMDLFGAMLVGAAKAVHHGAAEAARQLGASEETALRFGKGAAEFAEWKVTDFASHGVHISEPEALAYRLKLTQDRIKPWTDQGKLPPVGVDYFADRALALKAKDDTRAIDEILDEAEKSLVVERSSETVEDLIRPLLKDKVSAIPFEAVQRLYGDKMPAAEDGLLGNVEGFAEKYAAAARIGGGDIQLPLADWILKVPGEVRRELKKEFKPDHEGMNLEEAKEVEGPEAEAKEAEPPLAPGMARMYHGGQLPIGEEAGGLWFTSHRPKAEGYAGAEGSVSYVDLPQEHPLLETGIPGQGVKEGFTVERELPEEVARTRQLLRGPSKIEETTRRQAGLDQVNAITPVLLEEGQPEEPLFGKMALGLPKKDYDRFIKAIERQSEDEKAWELKKATEEIAKRKTKEWREAAKAMRPDVAFDVSNRPEWVAHNWFNDGVLRGTTDVKPKLDPKKMSLEHRMTIPKEYQAEGGMAPDDLARPAGFKTGDEMLDVMGRFYAEKGKTPPGEYLKRLVDSEVQGRMQAEHGKLPENIIAEAQDHVTGIPQMERLHETTVALGIKAGHGTPFTKEGMRSFAKGEVGRRLIGDQTRDLYLKEAGKAGRAMIEAFLKQDWNEAFRQSQFQYTLNLMAHETGKLLDGVGKLKSLAGKFSKAKDPESFRGPLGGVYVPYIQQALAKVGFRVGRTPEQIADAITQSREGTLEQFASTKRGQFRDIEIPDWWDRAPESIEKMTGDQFNDFHDMMIALDKHGRDEETVYRGDKAEDFDAVRETMRETLKTLGDVKIMIHKKPGKIKQLWNTYYPGSLTIESIVNRWDRDNAMGVFNQYLSRPLIEASNSEHRMIRIYQEALLKAVGDMGDMDKMVENSLWLDPYTKQPLDMSRRNVLGALMYWGNPSSRKKLMEGYGVNEREALEWLHHRTTKEDWDRAQNIGHIFDRLIGLADKMSMRVNGVPIKKIDVVPFDTIHGRYKGWYNPVEYESLFPGRTPNQVAEALKEAETMKLKGERILEQPGFYRATTNQSYIKARTEYVAPTAMDMDIIPARIKQMIHDITFREAVIQAGKFVYDPKWQSAVIHHYGKEYQELFIPFLKDVANYTNTSNGMADALISHFNQNLISTMIGFNPHTVAKHGMTAGFNSITEVGLQNFGEAFASLMRTNDQTGTTNWKFAMDRSEQLQSRLRGVAQYAHVPEVSLQKMGLRETLQTLGATPVAISDLLSSVPTWLAMYKKSLREGLSEADSVFVADRAVRRAHGSPAITNLPAIMRTNALGRTFTSLFGFFSHMAQKQFELAWKAKDSFAGVRAGDFSAAKAYTPQLISGFVSYVIIPAVVEEMVTPYKGHEKDSWGMWAFKTMTMGLFASYAGPKDFVRSMFNTGEAAVGMASAFAKEGLKFARDISKGKGAFDKKFAGQTIRDTVTMIGILKGYTNAQEGRVLQFFQRWMMGVDRPKEPWDWMHGFTTGRIDQPEYRRHR